MTGEELFTRKIGAGFQAKAQIFVCQITKLNVQAMLIIITAVQRVKSQ